MSWYYSPPGSSSSAGSISGIDVASLATGGNGSSGSPYTGWKAALPADLTHTRLDFRKAYYDLGSGSVGLDISFEGCVLQGIGMGTRLVYTGTGNAIQAYSPDAGQGIWDVVLRDLIIDGGLIGIDFKAIHQSVLEHLLLINQSGTGSIGVRTRFAVSGRWQDVAITQNRTGVVPTSLAKTGFLLDHRNGGEDTTNMILSNCKVESASSTLGVDLVNCQQIVIDGGTYEGLAAGTAIRFRPGSKYCVLRSVDLEANSQDVLFDTGSYSGTHRIDSCIRASTTPGTVPSGTWLTQDSNSVYATRFPNTPIPKSNLWSPSDNSVYAAKLNDASNGARIPVVGAGNLSDVNSNVPLLTDSDGSWANFVQATSPASYLQGTDAGAGTALHIPTNTSFGVGFRFKLRSLVTQSLISKYGPASHDKTVLFWFVNSTGLVLALYNSGDSSYQVVPTAPAGGWVVGVPHYVFFWYDYPTNIIYCQLMTTGEIRSVAFTGATSGDTSVWQIGANTNRAGATTADAQIADFFLWQGGYPNQGSRNYIAGGNKVVEPPWPA